MNDSRMKTLTHLRNDELLLQIKDLVKNERRITLEILRFLKEVERRRLFAERGYASLYDFVRKELGYSEAAAMRRIDSMRLLTEVPELAEKVLDGKVNLTTLSKTKSVLRAQEKISGVKVSAEQKREVAQLIENKSALETAQTLFEIFPEAAKSVEKTKVTAVSETMIRLNLNLSNEAMTVLEKAKALLSHTIPDGDLGKVIERLAQEFIDRKDPLSPKNQKKSEKLEEMKNKIVLQTSLLGVSGYAPPALHTGLASAAEALCGEKVPLRNGQLEKIPKARAYISVKLKKEVWRKSQGRCGYVDPITKRKCEAKHFLEVDHIKPIAFGGGNEFENLRLLCRTHNQLRVPPVQSTSKNGGDPRR